METYLVLSYIESKIYIDRRLVQELGKSEEFNKFFSIVVTVVWYFQHNFFLNGGVATLNLSFMPSQDLGIRNGFICQELHTTQGVIAAFLFSV